MLGSGIQFCGVTRDNHLGTYSSNRELLILGAGEVKVGRLDVLGTDQPVKVRGRTYSIVQERDVDETASSIWAYSSIDTEGEDLSKLKATCARVSLSHELGRRSLAT